MYQDTDDERARLRSVLNAMTDAVFLYDSVGRLVEMSPSAAHIDGLETREDRRIIRRTCFSIEPGIYLPDFGVRSEVDVYIDRDGKVHITGVEPQKEVHKIII